MSEPTITPYLIVDDAAGAIEFYKTVFAAKESFRFNDAKGKIAHAELWIGNSPIMLADVNPEYHNKSPIEIGGTPVTIHIYVHDVDDTFATAEKCGATVMMPVKDQFYGDRSGAVRDPFGHQWHIATHKEDVSPAEVMRRWDEMKK